MTTGAPRSLLYLHTVPLSKDHANVIQVLKTCDALCRGGADVRLVTPWTWRASSRTEEQLRKLGLGDTSIRFSFAPLFRIPLGEWLFCSIGALMGRATGASRAITRSITCCYLLALLGFQTTFEAHTAPDEYRKSRQKRLRLFLSHKNSNGVVVISDRLKERFRSWGTPKPLHLVRDAADEIHSSQTLAKDSGDRPTIGYTGHLYPGKGMEIIAQLVPLLPEQDFEIVGGDAAWVAHWKNQLKAHPNVRFLGWVPHAQIGARLLQYQVVLAPYQKVIRGAGSSKLDLADGMSPLKLFEYMAAGCAIVASDLPAIREILADEKTALLCDAEDPSAWQMAIQRLLVDPDLRHKLGDAARTTFVAEHTWEQRAKDLERIIWPSVGSPAH